METNLFITIYQKNRTEEKQLSFWDILLDETLISGTIYIPWECFKKVSTINRRLPAKQVYELLLRMSQEFPVYLTGKQPELAECFWTIEGKQPSVDMEGLKTDCYIVARYKKMLLEQQLFDSAVSSILEQATSIGCEEKVTALLSGMLQGDAVWEYLYLGSQPFLIYTGDAVCYNILSVFAEELGSAFRRLGYLVEYFDLSREDFTESFRLIGRSFQAVIGVQSYMFSVRLNDNQGFLHDKIIGPKYNYVFDHPVRFEQHLKEAPKNLTIFTLDRSYAAFAQKHYPVNAKFFPPAGIAREFTEEKRIYNITFIGTYFDNRQDIRDDLMKLDRKKRFLVNRLWMVMRKSPRLSAEKALSLAVEYYHYSLSDSEFAELLHDMMKFIVFMTHEYRQKILKTLVEAGIKVDVFGTSWSTSALRRNPNFIWHNKDLTTEECLVVWQQSKMALNVMSWHKDGITERILNSMLQKAVVLTERNPYMEEHFKDGEDVALYDLAHLEKLPELVVNLLENEKCRVDIAERGYQKALASHTWDCRAKELIGIAEEAHTM